MYLLIIFFIILLVILLTMFNATFKAAPWVPSGKKNIEKILELAEIKKGDVVYDLGSGDARWLIALAKKTEASKIIGYEISFLPYFISRIKLLFMRKNNIKILFKDFFKADFSKANVILCFLTPMAMKKLEPKLKSELKPKTKFISYAFRLPNTEFTKKSKVTEKSLPIYLYQY